MLLETAPILSMNSPVFAILVSCVAIFVTVYFNNRKIKIDMNKENDNKIKQKADLSYVKEHNLLFDKKFENVDAFIELVDANNSGQHKNLFSKIEEVGKGVSRIEGYLEAMKENKK